MNALVFMWINNWQSGPESQGLFIYYKIVHKFHIIGWKGWKLKDLTDPVPWWLRLFIQRHHLILVNMSLDKPTSLTESRQRLPSIPYGICHILMSDVLDLFWPIPALSYVGFVQYAKIPFSMPWCGEAIKIVEAQLGTILLPLCEAGFIRQFMILFNIENVNYLDQTISVEYVDSVKYSITNCYFWGHSSL